MVTVGNTVISNSLRGPASAKAKGVLEPHTGRADDLNNHRGSFPARKPLSPSGTNAERFPTLRLPATSGQWDFVLLADMIFFSINYNLDQQEHLNEKVPGGQCHRRAHPYTFKFRASCTYVLRFVCAFYQLRK